MKEAHVEVPYFLSVTAASRALGFKPDTIRQLVKRGELPAIRVGRGRAIRIPVAALKLFERTAMMQQLCGREELDS
jgi:excisionase family DNA binding protein